MRVALIPNTELLQSKHVQLFRVFQCEQAFIKPRVCQVSTQGLQSTPLNLAVSWRCEPTSTDLRIDYKYNGEAMSTPMALNNVQFLVPVDGGVSKLQAVLPPAAWYGLSRLVVTQY